MQKQEPRPESPTTAKALDFDDDTAETPVSPPKSAPSTLNPPLASQEATAPPKPPRPLAPEQQAENTLKDAFPSIDATVVKAVLRASGGRLEPAFNALLGMSDPNAVEPTPPPQPPRRQQSPPRPTSTEYDQLAADERYARELAQRYEANNYTAMPRQNPRPPEKVKSIPRRATGPASNEYDEDRERSFLDGSFSLLYQDERLLNMCR